MSHAQIQQMPCHSSVCRVNEIQLSLSRRVRNFECHTFEMCETNTGIAAKISRQQRPRNAVRLRLKIEEMRKSESNLENRRRHINH